MVLSDPLLVEGEPGGAYIPEIHNLKDRKIKYAQQQTCKYIQTKLILERNHVYLKTFKQTVCWVAGRENWIRVLSSSHNLQSIQCTLQLGALAIVVWVRGGLGLPGADLPIELFPRTTFHPSLLKVPLKYLDNSDHLFSAASFTYLVQSVYMV